MIVADTCLIFHLFNETALTIMAQKILEIDSHWICPQIWREEYANVLSKLARKEKSNSNEILILYSKTVEEIQSSEQFVDAYSALEIALKHKISVYDAHFIFLAIEYNTILITEDVELLKKCPDWTCNFTKFNLNYI